MSEIQSPPASFSWDPATDAVSLTPKLNSTHVRLLSIKTYLKGSARKLAAIWIKEENPGWGWNPSISAADLKTTLGTDSRLVTLDAFWEKGAVKCAAAWIPKKNVFSNWSAQLVQRTSRHS